MMSGFAGMPRLFYEMKQSFVEITHNKIEKILEDWEGIYGTSSEVVIKELTEELETSFKEFWNEQFDKLQLIKKSFSKKIAAAGQEATLLEKALGIENRVIQIPQDLPLSQMNEQLQSLLETYQEMKNKRFKEYFILQEKDQELCLILDVKTPKYKFEDPHDENRCVPTSDDLNELKERIRKMEPLKEQLEYDFEDAKCQLRSLLEELEFPPITKEERCSYGEELPVTKKNLLMLKCQVDIHSKKKEELMAEADQLRNEIDRLYRKMSKNFNEHEEFLSTHSGFSEPTIKKLKDRLKELKEQRKQNLKDLIANSRKVLEEWWTKCCYSQDQRDEFTAFKTTRRTEEVLEIHELEIEKLENFYNTHKKIFDLAKRHEELWEQLLHLEKLANDKNRLFKNRGGCLLKEEKERKALQKRFPMIKAQLIELLEAYKEETGNDFLHYGEPLQWKIEMKEYDREVSKQREREQRKEAHLETNMIESRLGARPATGIKRKAMTPQHSNHLKTMRIETTSSASSKSTLSSKSTTSSAGVGTVVQRAKENVHGQTPNIPGVNYVLRTPTRNRRIPAASTPQNGSLSYESFQEYIEKSKNLAHNSTRNTEKQRVLQPKNLNQTRTVVEKTSLYKTPKTPGRTFVKTPSKTPSKIPFRIPTGSKIPSQVPPISPGKPVLSTTKLPIIF